MDAGEKITLKPLNFNEFIDSAICKNFAEKEILSKLYKAKLYPEKMDELKKLFNPKLL